MSDVDPILLLLVGLVLVARTVLWIFSMPLAARIARQGGANAGPWVLVAIGSGLVPGGMVLLGVGYLARSFRRVFGLWILAQILVLAVVAIGAGWALPRVMGWSLLTDLLILLATLAAALSPLIVLAVLGPSRARRGEGEEHDKLLSAAALHKFYRLGQRSLHVLRGVSLSVRRGEFVAILGASGSGKSTFLHILGLLDNPDSGRLTLDGTDSAALVGPHRDRFRSQDVGFVFQLYHLLPELNVLDNVLLPVRTSVGVLGWLRTRSQARRRAEELLKRLGLSERLKHRPRELSGGEQQRVAIARALINQPRLLLADEPTGNLDSRTGKRIVELLKQLNEDTGQTIVMVTHDQALASIADRVLHLRDGKLQ
ncbi:MAG: ABC transporter ATP-binding protein [Planctomycetota bacterium]|jgi:ABC-type lipoprotein export system ATPase subunit